MPSFTKNGKRIGRPPNQAAHDFRPNLLEALSRFRLIPLMVAELEKLAAELSPRDRVNIYMELCRMGLAASPKTLDIGESPSVQLIISGISQNRPIDGTVVQAEPAEEVRALPIRASHRPMPAPRAERSAGVSSKSPPPAPEPEPAPPAGPVFTVPRGPDEFGPAEWRSKLPVSFEEDI